MLKRIFLIALCGLSFGTFLIAPAFATDTPIIPKPTFLPGPDPSISQDGDGIQDYILNTTVPRIINIITGLLGILAFIGIIVASFNMLTAYGNEDKYNRAKTTLRYSIEGFLIVILSYALVSVFVSFALPEEEPSDAGTSWMIPSAHAVDVEDDVDVLFPSETTLIEEQGGKERGVSLPSGDFLTEIVPAAIINVYFFVGFLAFIALLVAGVMLVYGRGNEEVVTKAKRILNYSAIALALMALGYALIFGVATLLFEPEPGQEDEGFQVFVDEGNE